jgi:hypothetical protein
VVKVTEEGESLIEVYGKGQKFGFLFMSHPGGDPINYSRFSSSKDSWSVDTKIRDMTRYSENVVISERIFINRLTGSLTYLRDEAKPEYSLRKVSASGKCEGMDGKPSKF